MLKLKSTQLPRYFYCRQTLDNTITGPLEFAPFYMCTALFNIDAALNLALLLF